MHNTVNVRCISINLIRRDGDTQHRLRLNEDVVHHYADLLKEGVLLPPVRIWWDGESYWLADGFHRTAAAERIGALEIVAEVRLGSLSDAQWDSYAANQLHGLRWTSAETHKLLKCAMQHPNARAASNLELARHLHLPETTIRRWRQKLSSPSGEDRRRTVTRNGTTNTLATDNIGRRSSKRHHKSKDSLRSDLALMKSQGSDDLRRLLNIVANWVLGGAAPMDCVMAMERVISAAREPLSPLARDAGGVTAVIALEPVHQPD